jgi:hypothetical protein
MWSIFIGALIGAVTSIGTAIGVEYLRRPRLELGIEEPPLDVTYPPDRAAQSARFVRVTLRNKGLPRVMQWMVRVPALQCRAAITFHHLDGQNIFGRTMDGRWPASPEPVPLPVVNGTGQISFLVDYARLTLQSRIDVYPGETELLDIAVRFDRDPECYGWSNENYFSDPIWRNPNWRLASARYLVRVRVFSAGQKCLGCFRLVNDVSRGDFRLEPVTDRERAVLAHV